MKRSDWNGNIPLPNFHLPPNISFKSPKTNEIPLTTKPKIHVMYIIFTSSYKYHLKRKSKRKTKFLNQKNLTFEGSIIIYQELYMVSNKTKVG
jgi:hypothetical protein